MPSRPEPTHVKKYKNDEGEGGGTGWKPCRPVRHAEFLKEAHGAPVIQGWFLQPRLAIENWRDGSSCNAMVGATQVIQTKTSRHHLGVDFMTCL